MAINDTVDYAMTESSGGVSPRGDLDVITGIECVRNRIYRRIITIPGTMAHRPEFGAGLALYSGAVPTLPLRQKLALAIKQQIELDPDVDEVTSVSISTEDGTPETVEIVVKAKLAGYGEAELSYLPFAED